MKKTLLTLIITCFALFANAQIPVTPGSISGNLKMCPGDTCTYSVATVAHATFYVWTMPTGASIISDNDSSNVILVLFNTNFVGGNMTVAAGNPNGISPVRNKSISFNLLLAPTSITGNLEGICNSNQTYTVAWLATATSYLWTMVSPGLTINGSNSQSTVNIAVSNTFSSGQIMVSGVNGCGIGSARSLTIKGFPAQPGPITGEINVCMGGKYTYNIATVYNSDHYSWVVPGISDIVGITNGKSIDVGYCWVPASSQTVTVRAVNSCGQSSARTLTGIVSSECP